MNKGFYKKEISLYFFTGLITLFIFMCMVYESGFNYRVPFSYYGDSLFMGTVIKTVIDTGWYLKNSFFAAPYTSNLADFPLIEGSNFILLKILSFFSSDYAVVQNGFFLLSFILISLCSVYAFRYLGLRKLFALAASILFTFLPYHMYRGEEHLFLSAYYAVPIYVVFIFSLFNYKPVCFRPRAKWKPIKYFLSFIALVFAASSGVYYSFFACFFLLLAGVLASIDMKKWAPILRAIFLITIIGSIVGINALPTILYHRHEGPNLVVGNRQPLESELYGLKIIQLLLPMRNVGLTAIDNLRDNYNKTAPLVNENISSSLGIIASLGFLLQLAIIFFRNKLIINNTIFNLSRLNLAALLLGTIGGFGTVFAYTITPMIRCYNRISVYIAFFSLCTVFMVLQFFLKKWIPQEKGKLYFFIIILIALFGVIDQTGLHPNITNYEDVHEAFHRDARFVANIEKTLPKNSMIFQLPVVPYPENSPVNKMSDYSLFRAYLHSNTLRWSYGAMKGRIESSWQDALATKSTQEMIDELVYIGFRGLYLNRDGYPDEGKEIENKISTVLQSPPTIVDESNSLAFYDLQPYANNLQHSMSVVAWQSYVKQINADINLSIDWGAGLYSLEQNDNTSWHWSQQKSVLLFSNHANHNITIRLKCRIATGYPAYSSVWLSGDILNKTARVNQAGSTIDQDILIPPGRHSIYFKTDAKQVNAPMDNRSLFFAIYDFSAIPLVN